MPVRGASQREVLSCSRGLGCCIAGAPAAAVRWRCCDLVHLQWMDEISELWHTVSEPVDASWVPECRQESVARAEEVAVNALSYCLSCHRGDASLERVVRLVLEKQISLAGVILLLFNAEKLERGLILGASDPSNVWFCSVVMDKSRGARAF